MKKKRRKRPDAPDMPVGSFSDIAFLLIIFFIVATTLNKMSGVTTDIPAGEKSQGATAEKVPTVELHGERITFNKEDITMKGLRRRLAALDLDKKKGEERVVVLEASGEVAYQVYFDALASISAAHGVVAIVKEEGQGK